jgi:hypothetical protein
MKLSSHIAVKPNEGLFETDGTQIGRCTLRSLNSPPQDRSRNSTQTEHTNSATGLAVSPAADLQIDPVRNAALNVVVKALRPMQPNPWETDSSMPGDSPVGSGRPRKKAPRWRGSVAEGTLHFLRYAQNSVKKQPNIDLAPGIQRFFTVQG